MALERLTLAPVLLEEVPNGGGGEDMNKAPRLPRWTRQELLVLIQGKRVAENRVRRGRTAVLAFGSSSQVEPKWSSVSSYCKRHGVNRGPVQCRKRWSNLAGDFKKIKEWESQMKEEGGESFWVMRNDLRRERKLPGFFDREVYDILDGGGGADHNKSSLVLSLAPGSQQDDDELENTTTTTENEEVVVFDSGRSAQPDDGLFSDEVLATPPQQTTTAPTPISATQYEPFSPAAAAAAATTQDDKSSIPNPEETHEQQGRKRKRPATQQQQDINEVEEMSLQNQLIEAMERNGRLLSSQLEIQNTNSQLDREQRKDHANTLFAVLNKLADAMVRIADKF